LWRWAESASDSENQQSRQTAKYRSAKFHNLSIINKFGNVLEMSLPFAAVLFDKFVSWIWVPACPIRKEAPIPISVVITPTMRLAFWGGRTSW